MPGRKPKPNALKLLEGNLGKRPINKREPKPKKRASLAPPSHLNAAARAEWKRVAGELKEIGLFTGVDRAALALYCQAWGTWKENEDWIRENGQTFVVRDRDGILKGVYQFPQVMIAHRAAEQCRKLLPEFGLSPGARSRLEVPKASDDEADEGNKPYGATLSGRWKSSKRKNS